MKFNELPAFTRIKIAAELNELLLDDFQYRTPINRTNNGETSANEQIAEFEKAGIRWSPALMDDTDVVLSIHDPDAPDFFFGSEFDKDRLSISRDDEDNLMLCIKTSKEVGVDGFNDTDKFGLIGSIRIDEANLNESLKKINDMLVSYSKFIPIGKDCLDIMDLLLSGLTKAESLPETLWDKVDQYATLTKVFEDLSFNVSYNNYDFDPETGNHINLPPIIIVSERLRTIETKYSYDNPERSLLSLVVSYDEVSGSNQGTIEVACRFNTRAMLTLNKRVVPTSLSVQEFIDEIITAVNDGVSKSERADKLKDLKAHFVNTLNDGRSFIENKNVQPSYF